MKNKDETGNRKAESGNGELACSRHLASISNHHASRITHHVSPIITPHASRLTPHVSPIITPHASHITPHASRFTHHHASRITHHASRFTHHHASRFIHHHASRFTHHASRFTHHVSRITHHVSRFTHHVSRFTHHVSRFTHHASRITFHVSRITHHVSRITFQTLMLCAMLFTTVMAHAQPPLSGPEYKIKAGFVYNFIRFTTWPGKAFKSHKDPIIVCVAPFHHYNKPFLSLENSKAVKGKKLKVKKCEGNICSGNYDKSRHPPRMGFSARHKSKSDANLEKGERHSPMRDSGPKTGDGHLHGKGPKTEDSDIFHKIKTLPATLISQFQDAQEGPALENAEDCRVIFICSEDRRFIRKILSSLRHKPVLTVGEAEGFARMGGIIGFFLGKKNNLRYRVNLDALNRAGLRLSSKMLMSAAEIVKDGEK